MRPTVRIRDPIHGTQKVTKVEIAVVEHRAVQRLRGIKQLGMADLAYPGATHTRYAHALGVMHLAGRVFDAVTVDLELAPADRERMRATLRLAALFHDLGHAPLSHSTELMMPPVRALPLGSWRIGRAERRATHEDYTLAIVLASDLTRLIEARMSDLGVEAADVAALLTDHPPDERLARFVVGGRDFWPFLRQCVSSELDADRMDYLLRDSYFAGVPYGRYDLEWLIENLRLVEREEPWLGSGGTTPSPGETPIHPEPEATHRRSNGGGEPDAAPPEGRRSETPRARPAALHLALAARASFGFEDYLLSRYHMFLAVYLHHVPVGYELMLERLQKEGDPSFELPSDVDAYLDWDDVHFFFLLRRAKSRWAKRIIERRGYRLLLEHKQQDEEPDPLHRGRVPLREVIARLKEEGIPLETTGVRGRLSKYFMTADRTVDPTLTPHLPGFAPGREEARAPTLFVVEDGRAVPLETHVALYRRYRGEVSLERVYVPPERLDEARLILEGMGPHARANGPRPGI